MVEWAGESWHVMNFVSLKMGEEWEGAKPSTAANINETQFMFGKGARNVQSASK